MCRLELDDRWIEELSEHGILEMSLRRTGRRRRKRGDQVCTCLRSADGRNALLWVDEAGEPVHLLVQDLSLDEPERRIELSFGTIELCLEEGTLTVVLRVR
ncbi:MAG: hypothetical protein KTR31_19335 [Myxococcales bacterium]|nr:hypothetical protein [Myxococcales bacterium]